MVSLHIPPSTAFSCENAQPSNVPEWTENPLTNYPLDPLSTQLIDESISFAPLDKFQPFTDMTCVNKQSSDSWSNVSEYVPPRQAEFQLDDIGDSETNMDTDQTNDKCQWAMQALLLSSHFMDTWLI